MTPNIKPGIKTSEFWLNIATIISNTIIICIGIWAVGQGWIGGDALVGLIGVVLGNSWIAGKNSESRGRVKAPLSVVVQSRPTEPEPGATADSLRDAFNSGRGEA